MTLHWWMHWFWVTSLLTIIASSGKVSAAPPTEAQPSEEIEEHHTDRRPKAIYITKTSKIATTRIPPKANVTDKPVSTTNLTEIAPSISNATESSLSWTAVETGENATRANATEAEVEAPLSNATTPAPIANVTSQNATLTSKKPNRTRLDYAKDETGLEGVSESRIVTEKPLSLETAYLQTRIPPNVESSRRVIDDEGSGMDMGAIAGIAFAAVVLAALTGSTAFVLYRRRYLNKPQTLNDKMSNPDSSGYLDDSTIRDNSEEMYSLDNDSFLNSLEAMTIQNYWTDTVKHTKL